MKFIELEWIYLLTSLGTVLTWLNLFDYMRIFTESGFYILLLIQTLKDVRYFILLFFMCVAMFSSSVYLLNSLSYQSVTGESLFEKSYDNSGGLIDGDVINSFIN